MKRSIYALLASAAFLITAVSGHSAPSNTVSIKLDGTLASGKSFTVTSGTATIKPARVYYYAITGTCHGTGTYFGIAVPSGSDLNKVIGEIDPALSPYLQGNVVDLSGTLPFVCVNKLAKGTFVVPFFGLTINGQVQTTAGIKGNGVCYGQFQNLLFQINGVSDTSDTIVIDNGKCLVSVSPFSGAARPNLSFLSPIGHANGIGSLGLTAVGHSESVSLLKGETVSYIAILQNKGSVAGSFKLNASAAAAGFTQKFIYQTLDKTAAVTSAGGLTIPLAGGAAASLTWQLTNTSAVAGHTTKPVLTAVLTTSATAKDQLVISGTAE